MLTNSERPNGLLGLYLATASYHAFLFDNPSEDMNSISAEATVCNDRSVTLSLFVYYHAHRTLRQLYTVLGRPLSLFEGKSTLL